IDLNVDVGEGTAERPIDSDEVLIPLTTSANIACGAHGGDLVYVERAVRLAVEHGVQIGAHPGYPDRPNFGRQAMQLSEMQLRDTLAEQLVNSIVVREGGKISYVKPHGALYHACGTDADLASCVIACVQEFSDGLPLVGQANTVFQRACLDRRSRFVAEAFGDRVYLRGGQLKPRSSAGAMIDLPQGVARQAVAIATKSKVKADDGQWISVDAETICLHGDGKNAGQVIAAVRAGLSSAAVELRGFLVQ
ncbi:UNVERIFIED_CONTAM: hypothetical protein GTU68_003877, partial [Idotea baltica]|nr:hypothetical protein [Idotea baltica]